MERFQSVCQQEKRGIVLGLFSGRREAKRRRRKDRGSGQTALLLQRLSLRRTGASLSVGRCVVTC